jgi:IS4 transposase
LTGSHSTSPSWNQRRDTDAKDSIFLKAEQTFTDKKRGRKPKCTMGMEEPDSLTGWYLRMLTRNCKQLLSICKLLVADAYFSKESFVTGVKDVFDIYRARFQLEFVFRDAKQFTGLTHWQARNKEAMAFAFNASLTSVNVARAFARRQGMDLSVGSTKTLLHNAAMVERFIAMSAKRPNMRLNNTDFKELLFYGVRAAA